MIRIFILLLTLCCPFYVFGQQTSEAGNNARPSPQQKPEQPAAANIISSPDSAAIQALKEIADNVKPDPEAITRQDERGLKTLELQEGGLAQQKQMTEYTGTLSQATLTQVRLSLIGILLVSGTLIATAIAAWAAQKSARAAENVIKQNRAWILISKHNKIRNFGQRNVRINIPIFIKNFGKSPAINLEGQQRMESRSVEEIGSAVPDFSPTDEWTNFGIFGPDAERRHTEKLDHHQVAQIISGKFRYFIFTFLRYETIYEQKCETKAIQEVVIHERPAHELESGELIQIKDESGLIKSVRVDIRLEYVGEQQAT